MAAQWPGASFLGLDFSARQVADGVKTVERLGLGNIQLRHMNILDVTRELGEFDYIIAHGVFSWVPREVQEKILSICSENLSARGVAYVSYNTLPGWRMRGIIRDIMLFRGKRYANPNERLRQATGMIDFLARTVAGDNNPYPVLLKSELESMKRHDESYLHHDHLEEINDPCYFHEFATRLTAHGLQYLGEADFGTMCPQNFPGPVESFLQSISGDVIELEQYMDFIRNRTFRQTLIVKQGVAIDRKMRPGAILKMRVMAPAEPEGELGDLRDNRMVGFKVGGNTLKTADPIMKAVLLTLGQAYPRSVPFAQLVAGAYARLSPGQPVMVDLEVASPGTMHIAENLLKCFMTGQVSLTKEAAAIRTDVSGEGLTAFPLARVQAELGNRVTNLRHENVRLDDLERQVIKLLDGTRTREAVVGEVVKAAEEGKIVVQTSAPPELAKRLDVLLKMPVEQAVSNLCRKGLLAA
jgi:methyltransferase-like protein